MSAQQDSLENLASDITSNGLMFLRRSVYQLNSEQSTLESLSFAIVDLATSVEVLMKARLVQEHWTLIASNPDKVTVPSMVSGDTNTVTPDQAAKRLEDIVGINLKANGRSDQLRTLTKLRNRAIHFSMKPTPLEALQACLGQGLDFALWLLDHEFRGRGDQAVVTLVDDCIDELTTIVGKINALVKERMAAIAPQLENADVCVECPRCSHPALTLTQNEPSRCAFCLWMPIDGADCAEEYASMLVSSSQYQAVMDGAEWPVYSCPECSEDSFVEGVRQVRPALTMATSSGSAQDVEQQAHWGCFGCGMTSTRGRFDHCNRCGELTSTNGDDSVPICDNCWGHILRD